MSGVGRGARARIGALGLAAGLVLSACSTGVGGLPGGSTSPPSAAPTAAASTACPTSQPAPLPAGQTRTVTLQTAKGSIAIAVDGSLGPIATGNFVALAACGYYDGVVFHRVVPGFVIQAGDREFGSAASFDPQHVGTGGPGYTIADEPVVGQYTRGTVAMARTSEPHSQGSQFFICLDDLTGRLDPAGGYVILGHVTSGLDAVDAIAAAADAELPSHPIAMDKVTVSSP